MFRSLPAKQTVTGAQGETLEFDRLTMRQSLHLERCRDCVVHVRTKCNAISLNACENVVLYFDALVSSCDVINSRAVRVACARTCSTFVVDLSAHVRVEFPRTAERVVVTSSRNTADVCLVATADAPGAAYPHDHQQLTSILSSSSSSSASASASSSSSSSSESHEAVDFSSEIGAHDERQLFTAADYAVLAAPGSEGVAEAEAEGGSASVPGGAVADAVPPQHYTLWEDGRFRSELIVREGMVGYVRNFQA